MKAEAYDRIYRNPIHAELASLGPEALTDPRVAGLSNGFLDHEDLERLSTLLRRALSHEAPPHEAPPHEAPPHEAPPHEAPPREEVRPLLLDLGCGRGALGRVLAGRLGARLVGIDGSAAAIELARASASDPTERFVVADFAATGLATGAVAVAFSHDALYMSEDPEAALDELRRVLRPGGGLVFTAYSSVRTPWEALAAARGFCVEQVDDLTGRWRALMRAKHERRWSMRDALRRKHGRRIEPELSVTASMLGLSGRPPAIDGIERRSISLRRR